MPEIKTREKVEKTIKTLDKGKVFREKVRKPNIKEADASVDLTSKPATNDPKERVSHAPGGDKGDEKEDDSSVVSYADSKLKSGEEKGCEAGKKTVTRIKDYGKKQWKKSSRNRTNGSTSDKHFPKTKGKNRPKTKGRTIKKASYEVKNAKRTTKTAEKAAKQSAKDAARAEQKAKKRANVDETAGEK